MTYFIWTHPVARKGHRCAICGRRITPGETYARMAGLDHSEAWTAKECEHCHRAVGKYLNEWGEYEYDRDGVLEWLQDMEPTAWSQMVAGWRTPEGELLPPPFERVA